MSNKVALVWFRQDLRLRDNPALFRAREASTTVIPVFIWSPEEEAEWAYGAASKWYLHYSLESLSKDLQAAGSSLILRQGSTEQTLLQLVKETSADAVYWNRRYEPAILERDSAIKQQLKQEGLHVESTNGSLLFEPWETSTGSGTPYKVYTPFSKKYFAKEDQIRSPLAQIKKLSGPNSFPHSLKIEELSLLPRIDWAEQMRAFWQPGEIGANARLKKFAASSVHSYDEGRDRPDRDGTSCLSPALHFGELSPQQVWHAVIKANKTAITSGSKIYLKEVVWREFAYQLLYHFPATKSEPLRPEFAKFPWRKNSKRQEKWQLGKTGYPMVDAGMRQLWALGWMHNRVRMIVASFLIKHLNIPWQEGAAWFWDTLVDADLASNTLGWQWTAGCGADASPFFRIFNPISQGEKFDPQGEYIRRWVPELKEVPKKYIHKPWEAPEAILKSSGIVLGKDYPRPIVDHREARQEALENYEQIKS